jgi:hypothetical protein
MCPVLISIENPTTFFDHVRFNHRNSGKFYVVCKYPNCHDEYNLYISFKRHWYKNHGRRALVTVPNHPLVNHDRGNMFNFRILKSLIMILYNCSGGQLLLEAVHENIQIEYLYRDNNIPDVQHNPHHLIENNLLSVNDNGNFLKWKNCIIPQSNNHTIVIFHTIDEILETCDETIEPVGDEHKDSTSENSIIVQHNPHREIQSVTNAAADDGEFGNLECWEAGILLLLRQRYFLPFDALQEV